MLELEFLFSAFYFHSGVSLRTEDIIEIIDDRASVCVQTAWQSLRLTLSSSYKMRKFLHELEPSNEMLEEIEDYVNKKQLTDDAGLNLQEELKDFTQRLKKHYLWGRSERNKGIHRELNQFIVQHCPVNSLLYDTRHNSKCQEILRSKNLPFFSGFNIVSVPGPEVRVYKFVDSYPEMYLVVHPSFFEPSAFTEESVENMRRSLDSSSLIISD